MNRGPMDHLWDTRKTAEFLGLQPDTVRIMARLQRIPALKLGHRWRFSPKEIRAWLETKVVRGEELMEEVE